MKKISVILPCAKAGRRMITFGPRANILIGSETLIQRQIRIIKDCFPNYSIEFIVIGGFEIESLKNNLPGIKVVQNTFFDSTSVAYSIALGLKQIKNKFGAIICYGDLVFNKATINGLRTDESCAVITDKGDIGATIVDGEITRFSYGIPNKWASIFSLSYKERILFTEIAMAEHRKSYYTHEILNEVINRGGTIRPFKPIGSVISEIDSSRDIKQAQNIGKEIYI